jgi:hypothetical protein
MNPHIPIPAEPSGNLYWGGQVFLSLHCPETVTASPAFLAAVPREAMIRVLRAYHRGFWGRIREDDRVCHEGRNGFLTGCYSVAGVRVHVVTDHEATWVMLNWE